MHPPAHGVPVVIVADAGAGAGLGHIARCSAIAVALAARGVPARCLAVGVSELPEGVVVWEAVPEERLIPPVETDLLLLDSYRMTAAVAGSSVSARSLVAMHDLGELPRGAQLVITTDEELVGSRPGVVGGPRFACLGPRYWGLPEPEGFPTRVAEVLVATGGGDPGGHAVPLAEAVRGAIPGSNVRLVRGPHAVFTAPESVELVDRPASLLPLLLEADLAVTAGGSTMLEALAAGTPAVVAVVADNQLPIARRLANAGAVRAFPAGDLGPLAASVAELAGDGRLRAEQARRARKLVDGHGALRVAFLIERLLMMPARIVDRPSGDG